MSIDAIWPYDISRVILGKIILFTLDWLYDWLLSHLHPFQKTSDHVDGVCSATSELSDNLDILTTGLPL